MISFAITTQICPLLTLGGSEQGKLPQLRRLYPAHLRERRDHIEATLAFGICLKNNIYKMFTFKTF